MCENIKKPKINLHIPKKKLRSIGDIVSVVRVLRKKLNITISQKQLLHLVTRYLVDLINNLMTSVILHYPDYAGKFMTITSKAFGEDFLTCKQITSCFVC